jgi:hypothetical protein
VTSTQSQSNDDQAWVDNHRQIIERAFAVFIETGQWPKLSELRRHFARLGQQVDLDEIIRSQPHFPGEMRPYHPDYLQLNIRHLRYVRQTATQLIIICLTITRRAVDAYLASDDQPRVTSDDPQIAALAGNDSRIIIRAGSVLDAEWPGPLGGGGSTGSDQWEYFPNEALVMEFQRVVSADDFVAHQQKVAERHQQGMAKHYASAGFAQTGIEAEPTSEPYIFVIMPFSPQWSRGVYDLIRRAVSGLGLTPTPLVERADDIAKPGRITDQIVQAINAAKVVIADISELNPNVMWELGYAHAMGKSVVLMNQTINASPFDIRDYRQVVYTAYPTQDHETQLSRAILAALEAAS